ncbi:MAG: aspartyl/glutamyl-tRNA amidotransferase subunit B [Gammaproteobacteria bacterium RIFCSPHIGHO2_12_FULL_41_15]|nr:MAG: aspartyl/glutamyl-tRNA amidotransferase subunit B [Gammaproteobacteria bacterium RIFCSPHIGHO2_12_FULL_41_15]
MHWEIIIGLETHVQLATQSKLFSGSATTFGAEPNTQACAIDLAMPGMLPVVNQEAIHMAVKFGVAVNANINVESQFARKNYFYPDLPKGYQISQHDHPILQGGTIEFRMDGEKKQVNLHHAHLEEDAGKSIHGIEMGMTGVDLNRAGTPLLEIVTDPDLRSATEVIAYLKTLRNLVRALGISDANMQEGSFRCDVNVSIRRQGATEYGMRTEIKNLNSFRFIEKAIQFESKRQIDLLQSGQSVAQETRLYDEQKQITKSMRSKEDSPDYRYFPDPDLLPIVVSEALINEVRANLPELPNAKMERYQTAFQLSSEEADKIVNNPDLCLFFEETITKFSVPEKMAANWLVGDISALLNKEDISLAEAKLKPSHLAKLLERVNNQIISTSIGKQILNDIWAHGGEVDAIIHSKDLQQISDTNELETIIDKIIADNPNQVEQIRNGKTKVLTFFVGQIMKATKGTANPGQVNSLLKAKLGL